MLGNLLETPPTWPLLMDFEVAFLRLKRKGNVKIPATFLAAALINMRGEEELEFFAWPWPCCWKLESCFLWLDRRLWGVLGDFFICRGYGYGLFVFVE